MEQNITNVMIFGPDKCFVFFKITISKTLISNKHISRTMLSKHMVFLATMCNHGRPGQTDLHLPTDHLMNMQLIDLQLLLEVLRAALIFPN